MMNKADTIEFTTGKLTAVIDKLPLRLSFYKNKKLLIAEQNNYFSSHYFLENREITQINTIETSVEFQFLLSENEKLLGGGERILGMNRRGNAMPLYNKADYGYSTESNQMYFGLPAIMSSKKYILLFDNPAKGNMDLGKKRSNVLAFNAVGGAVHILFFLAIATLN